MNLKKNMMKVGQWILVVFCIVIALIAFGYFNHINLQDKQAERFEKSAVKIEPIDACHIFIGVNPSAAPYLKYRSKIYECTNGYQVKNNFGFASYTQKSIGLKDSVFDNELTLTVKDNTHTTEKSQAELDVNKRQFAFFMDVIDLSLSLYGESVDSKLKADTQALFEGGKEFQREFPKFLISGEVIKQNAGTQIFKINFKAK